MRLQIRKQPQRDGNFHQLLPPRTDFEQLFSIHRLSILRNDNTVSYKNQLYQILDPWKGSRPKKIQIEERLDGSIRLTYGGRKLSSNKR